MKPINIVVYILLLTIIVSDCSSDSVSEKVKGLEFVELFSSGTGEDKSCYRIPTIITAANGDLIVAIDQRVPSCQDLKANDDINIVIRRSSDNGRSWSDIKTIVDYPLGESASDPSFILDQHTGTIFLFYNYMDLAGEKDVYHMKLIKSMDHGNTWTGPFNITDQISKPEWYNDFKFITSGKGTQLRDGSLVHTMVNIEKGLHLFKSSDHGLSWKLIDTPIKPADESRIIELSDGRWMVNSRVNNLGYRYIHLSEDRGASWVSKTDTQLIDPGCNASIIRYSPHDRKGVKEDKILIFSNVSSKVSRENMTVKTSFDDGETWSEGKTVYEGKSAYSSMTLLKNGDIGLFFEKDDYRKVVFVSLPWSWVSGKDG